MATPYFSINRLNTLPRIPLEGNIDLTYRCNNTCRHCWLWLAPNASEQNDELSFDEIRTIADQARAMGTRTWHISGGEPMLRPDFPEIFDYLTTKAITYSLNTNGTLITPEIAQQLKRKGSKMIALYGATAETYDHVTRNPGGFELAMRGFRYMQEAGAGFTVQLIPMRDNWHEWEKMQTLAKSLSPNFRVGAAWLFKSASGSEARNAEIERQRLNPRNSVALDPPDSSQEDIGEHEIKQELGNDRLFASCIAERRDFHIDPYGRMTFCSFLKEPTMRYDLRKGTFLDAWDNFIPSLANKVFGNAKYRIKCAECDLTSDCRWCPAYGYLEHGDFSAPVEYLCAMAKENREFKEKLMMNHHRYFRIAGITLQVDSELPIKDTTFSDSISHFRVDGPGEDMVRIHLHFEIPEIYNQDFGKAVYPGKPWAVYRKGDEWIYKIDMEQENNPTPRQVVVANHNHTHVNSYFNGDAEYHQGNLNALTMMTSDQILIARLLANRNGCYLHSAGAIFEGSGLLFVGHSDAGKSTMTRFLMNTGNVRTEVLCDDRNILRRQEGDHGGHLGWRVYGTWSHGDVPDVSPASAPLHAICFIEKADENTLKLLNDPKEIRHRLLEYIIKPFVTSDWWNKTIDIIEQLAVEVPSYIMRFDKSGAILGELSKLKTKNNL